MNFKQFFEQSYGIITAQNPGGEKRSGKENEDLNKRLATDLKDYKTEKKKGTYNKMPEDVYKVFGISKEKLSELAKKYGQVSVVWVKDGKSVKIGGTNPPND